MKVPAGIYNLSDPKEYTYDELLRWKKPNWVLPIPAFSVRLLYYLGKFFNSTFLKENSVKLISDNIYPSDNICSFIDLPETINDAKPNLVDGADKNTNIDDEIDNIQK